MARELKLITGLVELDRTSLRERALEMVRKAVTAGEIEPGSRLVETELSAVMGISRGTLREALRQLEYEGLIEVGERGRLTVRTLTDAELADMFTVRAALEGLAAATISTRPDRDVLLPELQTALDALQAADGSINDMVDADLAFHRLLCELPATPPWSGPGRHSPARSGWRSCSPARQQRWPTWPQPAISVFWTPSAAVTRAPPAALSTAHMREAARTLLAHGEASETVTICQQSTDSARQVMLD